MVSILLGSSFDRVGRTSKLFIGGQPIHGCPLVSCFPKLVSDFSLDVSDLRSETDTLVYGLIGEKDTSCGVKLEC